MMRSATVYFRADQIFVWGYSRTVEGAFVVNGCHDAMPVDVPDEVLGTAVLDALARNEDNVPAVTRDDINKTLRGLVRAGGRTSVKQYARDVVSVGVDVAEDGTTSVLPTRAYRERGSFEYLGNESFVVLAPPVDAAELGRAARTARDRCR